MSEMKSLTLNDKTYDSFVDQVARELAAASAVIKSASGESVTLSDASDVKLYGLNIYGRTTQEGVPTPDAPVDLVSVGDGGSITVNVTGNREAQNMTVATPNGLPGVPVADGGNYTDANGQQWVCDEIDFARGMYVRRIGDVTLDGTQTYWVNPYQLNAHGRYLFAWSPVRSLRPANDVPAISDKLLSDEWRSFTDAETRAMVYTTSEQLIVFLPDQTIQTAEAYASYLQTNPIRVLYQLDEPIETPLSKQELEAYSALHTYREHTTVSNDASAHMELEYVMDAKKYIDSLITGGIAPATVE